MIKGFTQLTQLHRDAVQKGGPKLDSTQSTSFRIARVLCIIFMTSTHAWPGSTRILNADTSIFSATIYFVIVDLFGRASVPLLSLISGLLFVLSIDRRGAKSVLASKFQTLLVPLVAWSAPMIVLLHLEPSITGSSPLRWDLMTWVNSLFSITASPANGPLHFFRDIFVMVCYGCLILTVARRHQRIGVVLALAIALLEQKAGGFLIFRNQIAVMFIAGMLMAMLGGINWRPGWKALASAFIAYALVWAFGWLDRTNDGILVQRLGELVPRIAVSLLMWRISHAIVTGWPLLTRWLSRLEPHIFVVFCAHALLVKPFALVATRSQISEDDPFFLGFLLLQMVVFVVVGVILSHFLKPFPWLRGKSTNSSKKLDRENGALRGRPV